MANLAEVLGINLQAQKVILVGKPELTGIMSESGDVPEPYYVFQLKEPVQVRCSTHREIPVHETSEVYVRESALASEKWQYVDPKKPEKGFFMEGWVTDFSVNQKIDLYQETTIREWRRTRNKLRGADRVKEAEQSLLEKYRAKESESK